MRFIVVAFSLLSSSVAFAQAEAKPAPCQDPSVALNGFAIPAASTTNAPTNTTPIVGDVGALELKLVDGSGNELPSTVETISVDNGFGVQGRLKRIVAQNPLPSGQNITVVADGSVVTQFGVGNDALSSTPDAPTADPTTSAASGSCSPSTTLAVGVQSGDAVLFIADVNGVPTLGGDVTLNGIANAVDGGTLTVFGTGSAVVNVAGVDLAGHVGASTPVNVKFPAPVGNNRNDPLRAFGCASTQQSASWFAAFAIGLGLVRVVRRRGR